MLTSKNCAGMTIDRIDDVVSYLSNHLLPRTTDKVDRVNLAKCVAVATSIAIREKGIRDATQQADEALVNELDRVRFYYGGT
jgi:hypothetical protein